MKLLISSHAFRPSVGGIETMSFVLAHACMDAGHEVKLVTQTPSAQLEDFPFEVIRQPGLKQLYDLVRWCDVYFQNGISLQLACPLVFVPRPWVVAHHTWISRVNGDKGWQDLLKQYMLRFATSISVSRAIAKHLPTPSITIPNCYRDEFRQLPGVPRTKQLVFLGRLVSDKGADILLRALAHLKQHKLSPELTIIGVGPEEQVLRRLAEDIGVAGQVDFVGQKTGLELVQLLNAHEILVVPSRWQEPFGLVALEGAACGCVVVGSAGGGLKEAIGPCGTTFANGDTKALAQQLALLLSSPRELKARRDRAEAHLSSYRSTKVASAYLKVLEGAAR